jgi:hypothetical protein
MDVIPLSRRRCLETNVVSEPFASNDYLSGSTVLALNKYAITAPLVQKQLYKTMLTEFLTGF